MPTLYNTWYIYFCIHDRCCYLMISSYATNVLLVNNGRNHNTNVKSYSFEVTAHQQSLTQSFTALCRRFREFVMENCFCECELHWRASVYIFNKKYIGIKD